MTLEAELLTRVNVWAALGVPTAKLPKFNEDGDSVTPATGVVPVPVRVTC